jgi:hypothetical protein
MSRKKALRNIKQQFFAMVCLPPALLGATIFNALEMNNRMSEWLETPGKNI